MASPTLATLSSTTGAIKRDAFTAAEVIGKAGEERSDVEVVGEFPYAGVDGFGFFLPDFEGEAKLLGDGEVGKEGPVLRDVA